jgi:hypothetical protein
MAFCQSRLMLLRETGHHQLEQKGTARAGEDANEIMVSAAAARER